MKMGRYSLSAIVVATGLVLSILLRHFMPSHIGLTITSPNVTHYVGLNVICFWCTIICALFVSLYLYTRPIVKP
jgi:hypothetical protein